MLVARRHVVSRRCSSLVEGGRLLGCANVDGCEAKHNATAVAPHYVVRASFRTALRALAGFRGRVVIRTVAPPHYENGKWYDGGNCERRGPMRSNETRLPETEAAFHAAQVEEFRAASAEAAPEGLRLVLMDVSKMMQMRGDAHPGQYGHWLHEKVGLAIDFVHSCLPGPVDAWSELLLPADSPLESTPERRAEVRLVALVVAVGRRAVEVEQHRQRRGRQQPHKRLHYEGGTAADGIDGITCG